MLDQNTDRMWYVIGAIVIGAVIIAMGLNIFSESFDSVDGMMASLTDMAGDNIASIHGGIYTDDEIDNLINNESYIPVATADELDSIRENKSQTFGLGTKWESNYTSGLNKKYVQVSNINLSRYSSGDGWMPIGDSNANFSGVYDGNGLAIQNLFVNRPDTEFIGLFGYTYRANLKHVLINNADVTGHKNVGGLVGRASSSEVAMSYSSGHIVAIDAWSGGIAGYLNNSKLINSYSTGNVEADNRSGVLVGGFYRSSEIINSYAKGLAWTYGENKYSKGYRGLIGANDPSGGRNTVENTYYDKDVGILDDDYGRTTEQMMSQSNYTDWDFDSIWKIDEGNDYPVFRWQ